VTHIARDPRGYVLPIRNQPWFDGSRTPKALIDAWEQANREDWKRFDVLLRREREAQAKSGAKAWMFPAAAVVLAFILAMVFR
jgi:hypothetical protein